VYFNRINSESENPMQKVEPKSGFEEYLGRSIRKVECTSSLPLSTSKWLNNSKIREVLPIWLLRRNGADFPVEADHTLGMEAAFADVLPEAEVSALFMDEMSSNPDLAAWVEARYVSIYRNEDFLAYPAGTVGGIIGHQIREHGFDLALGMGDVAWRELSPLQYFRRRSRQAHDLEHILTGGEFTSIGEIVVTMARVANLAEHLSPKLASALNAYQAFSGLRMFTRAMLHYPEAFVTALKCLEQGINVGRNSPPFWVFKWEEVFEMKPAEARRHFGVPEVDFIESARDEAFFREQAPI
jgi:ubiquinone biosynthesis protein COQ4